MTPDSHEPPTVELTLIPEVAMRALLAVPAEHDPRRSGCCSMACPGRLWPAGGGRRRARRFSRTPDNRGLVEIGQAIAAEFRRRGYAGAAVGELLVQAAEHGARIVRASVSVKNIASLTVIRGHDFHLVAEHWNEEDGQELIFERPAWQG